MQCIDVLGDSRCLILLTLTFQQEMLLRFLIEYKVIEPASTIAYLGKAVSLTPCTIFSIEATTRLQSSSESLF